MSPSEREQRERCRAPRQRQGLPGQLLMEPLANYCSLPVLLPVLPFCIRAQGIAILNPLFLHHPPLLPVSSQYELGVTGGLSLSSGGSSMGTTALGHTPGRARVQLFLPRSQPGKPMALPQLQGILCKIPWGAASPGAPSSRQGFLSLCYSRAGLPAESSPKAKAGLCLSEQLGRNGKRLVKGRGRCGAHARYRE